MKLLVMKMTARKEENFRLICKYLPERLRKAVECIPKEKINFLTEIRLRSEKPLVLIFTSSSGYITASGRLTEIFSNNVIYVKSAELTEAFNSICRYSVHSLTDDIAHGFVTLSGGCRVGVYGTAVKENGKIAGVRNISGLNIRLSGEYPEIARPIVNLAGDRANVLICGPPSSGKTTVMLDLIRILSDNFNRKISLVDERSESDKADTGINTDVLSGYPKPDGIEIAIRTLSPDIVAFDEIGSVAECEAVLSGLNSGVNFLMTIHCLDESELLRRRQFKLLNENNAVDYCVFLKNKGEISKILSAKELENENYSRNCTGTCVRSYGTIHSLQA